MALLPIGLHWNLTGKSKYSLLVMLNINYFKLFITSLPPENTCFIKILYL